MRVNSLFEHLFHLSIFIHIILLAPNTSSRFHALDGAVAVALAARSRHNIDSQFAVIDVVARVGRVASTLAASVIDESLEKLGGAVGSTAGAILIKGTDRSVLALRACQLDW